ncbi:MAG TPA: cytochrome c maturation protein CcmE [Gaiellaceae bacterium]|nr:cytochrome c maturation protein CcmE [Gaiellaceae bacterium]
MARSSRSPARLVVALSVAAVLVVFLVYTALANGTPALEPSDLDGQTGVISLTGTVIGPVSGGSHEAGGLRFGLRDINGTGPVEPVVFRGDEPDLFKVGRHVNVTGQLDGGSFTATQLTTKCPSKYTSSTSN